MFESNPWSEVHLAYIQSAIRDGKKKCPVPQKNAYAQLVQKHQSVYFRSYLNHVVQKMQLEKMDLSDAGLDEDAGMRNSLNICGTSTSQASLWNNLKCIDRKKLPDDGPAGFRKGAALPYPQAHQRGAGELEDARGAPGEGGPELKSLSWGLCSYRLIRSPRSGYAIQKGGSSEEKDMLDTGHKIQKIQCALNEDMEWEISAGRQYPLELPSLNSEKLGPFSSEQWAKSKAQKNPKLSGNTFSRFGNKRHLLEFEAKKHLDCRIPSKQLRTTKGVSPAVGCSRVGSLPGDKKMPSKVSQENKRTIFEPYMSRENVSAGLKRGTLIQGVLRINRKKNHKASIAFPDGTRDIFIDGVVARNRALNGDVVAVELLPKDEWKVIKRQESAKGAYALSESEVAEVLLETPPAELELGRSQANDSPNLILEAQLNERETENGWEHGLGMLAKGTENENAYAQSAPQVIFPKPQDLSLCPDRWLQRSAKVVYILEKKHSRAATGFLKLLAIKNNELFRKCALFFPTDLRVPRVYVPLGDCPVNFVTRPKDYARTLFVCRIVAWEEHNHFAVGQLTKILGQAGEIEPETERILMEHGVDFSDFSPEVLECLPQGLPWTIPPAEFTKRKDLRKDCVFTIDPSTARDLDDALSCKPLPDGNFEVGVHIADVSYFIPEGSALDKVASERATSIYLVQKVIPMLPRLLCQELCSLNPMTDRLTFSVIWKLSPEGKILDEWFGRTIIRSCTKLSYADAQSMIEHPDRKFQEDELPPVSAEHPVGEIHQAILNLHGIAKQLRQQRFVNGALHLDLPKLAFTLDQDTGMPQGCHIYKNQDSNRLVEEFMLLANMAVAQQIYRSFPERAILRRHLPPGSKDLSDLEELCDQLGLAMDFSSAGALHRSLAGVFGDDVNSLAWKEALKKICSRPMKTALYFCTGVLRDETQFRHYALNVPLYTHFTSPMRRFADVLVHRLLAASLDSKEPPNDVEALQKQADHCNDRHIASQHVQERSTNLFFAVMVREHGPVESEAVVMGVLENSFTVLLLRFGVQKRVYCHELPLQDYHFKKVGKKKELTLFWKPENPQQKAVLQEISIFSLVEVVLKAEKDTLRYSAVIKRPQTA